MALFIALTSRGLGPALHKDAEKLKIKVKESKPSWISFDCNWVDVTSFMLNSGAVTRVLRPLYEGSCYNQDDLYHLVQKVDFTKYIEPTGTLRVRVVGRSHIFRDTRFVALKVKDAIVDQFTEKFGKRPDVAAKNADLPIHITINNEKIAIHLDIAGQSLSQRGYRVETGEAPMREHMAAGLIDLSNIDFTKPIVDPMCGSGTLIIEAVARSMGVCLRTKESIKKLSYTRWKNLDADVKEKINKKIDEYVNRKLEPLKNNFFGSDHHPKMIECSKNNAKRAGIDVISFKQVSIADLTPPTENVGTLILNPPYGERLSDKEELNELFSQFAKVLRERFKGWTVWILSGDSDSTAALKMKSSQKIPITNGTIDCRWIKYEIF